MNEQESQSVNELGTTEPLPTRTRANRTPEQTAALEKFVIDAARLMSDLHCEDIVVFDVRGRSQITDFIMIASGTSDRQLRSVADDVNVLGKTVGLGKFGRDEDGQSTWIVLDLIDVIVHLFEPTARSHYDLEMMWGDAPRVPWQREE